GSWSRTSPAAPRDGWTRSCATWNSAAMRAYRSRCRLAMSAHLTVGAGYSLLPTLLASHPESIRDRKGYKVLPTLTVHGNHNRKGLSPTSGDGLVIALLPTLTVCQRDNAGGESPGPTRPILETLAKRGLLPTMTRRDEKGPGLNRTKGGSDLPGTLGGHLNPAWCEEYMGFPTGYTEAMVE